MRRSVHLILPLVVTACLAAAIAAAAVPGMFWLTVVAMAGVLGAGAASVGLRLRRAGRPAPAASGPARAVVRPRRSPEDAVESRRAA
jgi:hypothetical protein